MPEIWAEVWTRPGDATYGRRIADLPVIRGGATVGQSGVGQGNLSLPKNYSRISEILHTDPDTPANGVSSTIKLFSESQTDPIYEWLTGDVLPPTNKDQPDISISGPGIEVLAGYGQVEPWDWDGSATWVPTFPDWVYGGRNIVGNPGFEDSPCRPEVNEITIDPTVSGGTFTLSNSNGTTDPIAWNAAASTVENEIEDVGTGPVLDDVNVLGSGTPDDPYVVTFIDPCSFESGLVADFSALTPAPGDSALSRTQFGALIPTPWTKSQTVSDGTPVVHGDYVSFRVTTAEAHTGSFSLLIDPATIGRRYAGAQQILNVKRGGIYQASVWVRTNSASQQYRFVIRGIDEDLLLDTSGAPALLQMTLAASTWTLFSIPNVDVGDNDQIIMRIANINVTGNPAIFYVDDGEFNEGQPPATVGLMWGDLFDAWTDPTLRAPIVWDDGTATDTPYLILDFDDTLDSNGNAWADTHSLTFRPRMTGLQVLAEFVRLGYQWRVVPDTTPGYYQLQIYNPGTMGVVRAAGIQTGASEIRRNARFLIPAATQVTVQGQGFISSRAQSADLIGAFGRIEGSTLDLNLTSTVDLTVAATDAVASNNQGASSLVYTLKPYPGISEPLVAYRPADEITIGDPGIVQGQREVSQIELAWDKTGPEYTVYLGSVALVGQTAINQSVYDLMTKFERADELPQSAAVTVGGGGGAPTVVVAAVDATGMSQAKADFICSGVNDQDTINQAFAIVSPANAADSHSGGRVIFTEGNYSCTAVLTLPCNVHALGMAKHATRFTFNYTTPDGVGFDARNQNTQLSDMTVRILTTDSPSGLIAVRMGDEGTRVQNLHIVSEDIGVEIGPGQTCPPPT